MQVLGFHRRETVARMRRSPNDATPMSGGIRDFIPAAWLLLLCVLPQVPAVSARFADDADGPREVARRGSI
jgi:hypothetical protein